MSVNKGNKDFTSYEKDVWLTVVLDEGVIWTSAHEVKDFDRLISHDWFIKKSVSNAFTDCDKLKKTVVPSVIKTF